MQIYEDPRIRRTKKAFEDTFLELLKTKEYEKISVSNIAESSGFSRATFYLHYSSKEDLVEEYLRKQLEVLKANAEIASTEFRINSTEPHPLFIRIFNHIGENSSFYKTLLIQNLNLNITYSVIDIIESFIDSSNKRMEKSGIQFKTDHHVAKAYYAHAYLGVIKWWLKNDMPHSPKYMAKQLTLISTIGPYKENPFFKYEDKPY